MTASEADALCRDLRDRIWATNLGHVFDQVVTADRQGRIDDKLYTQLLDFFYCFVPMVVVAPRHDPVVVIGVYLQSHRRIMNMFGPGKAGGRESGPNMSHPWYSRPKCPGLLRNFLVHILPKMGSPLRDKKSPNMPSPNTRPRTDGAKKPAAGTGLERKLQREKLVKFRRSEVAS